MHKRRYLTSEFLEPRHLLAAQLVEDINAQRYGGVPPGPMVEMDGVAYFSAHSDGFGEELWRTDGTPAGTFLLKDIQTGTGSSQVQNLVNVNGRLYFTANDGQQGNELWKSDGTAAGTVKVRELVPGSAGIEVNLATAVNNTLYFEAKVPSVGSQLWKSDGTPDGTQLVVSAASSDNFFPIADMVNVAGTLYFSADISQDGTELWRTDGTPAGTTLVKDINPGPRDSVPYSLYNWNGKLIFNASAPGIGRELWISDGTSAGTNLLADLNLTDNDAYPQRFKSVGLQLFFVTEQGERLWVTDGTAPGTKLLLQVPPNTGLIASMFELSGKIYFGFGNYDKLWSSDGTVAGTGPVNDPSLGNLGVHPGAVNNNVLYLLGNDARGPELWSYIPTSSTLQFLGDLVPGGNGSYPRNLTVLHNKLTFFAGVHELWTSLGTPGTTQLVSSAFNQTASSNPRNLTNVQGVLYFSANESSYGSELWRSDGTAAGTSLLKGTTSYPIVKRGVDEWVPFVTIGSTLFFSSEFTLWRSDGTSAGTIPLGDSRFRNIRDLTVVKDKVYFVADDDQHGRALWVSDGTIAGTRSLTTELIPGHAIINARLLNLNDELVFRRITPQAVEEWWKSDGTRQGTSLLIRPSRYNIFDMFTLDGRTLFTQGNEVIGLDFWRFNSNGQPERVNTFCPGAPFETNQGVVIGTKFYYISMTTCYSGKFGVWELEGTHSRLIAEVDEPTGLTNVAGTLYFAAGVAGQKRIMTFADNSLQLAGTLPAKRLSDFTSAAGMLVFNAHTASGEELWMSDGKSVQQIDDIIPGSGGSDPKSPTVMGTNLFFSGWGEGIGRELWKVNIDRPPTSLTFTGADIKESMSIDTAIGTFQAIDPNGSTQFRYSLAAGAGDDDNARFTIEGNTLRLASRLDFEAGSERRIRVRVTDSGGNFYEQTFSFAVLDVNEAPVDIDLSANEVAENHDRALIGILTGVDVDANDQVELTMPAGVADNDLFSFAENRLWNEQPFDYEARSEYRIQITATDRQGLSFDKQLTVRVTDANDAPTAIRLSQYAFEENLPAGTIVAQLSAIDQDANDQHTYSLWPDESLPFKVEQNRLMLTQPLNFENAREYVILLTTVDSQGKAVSQDVSVEVNNVNEAPQGTYLPYNTIQEHSPIGSEVGYFGTLDPDENESLEYQILAGYDGHQFRVDGGRLVTAVMFEYATQPTAQLMIRAKDLGGLTADTLLTVYVTDSTPKATLVPVEKVTAKKEPLRIGVKVTDDTALEFASFDVNDIYLEHNGLTYSPSGWSVVGIGNGFDLVYHFDFPFEFWHPRNFGEYHIMVRANEIRDNLGLTVAASQLGILEINIVDSIWQNLLDGLDVNQDRNVTPLDALLVINHLNSARSPLLTFDDQLSSMIDVNGDWRATPMDALLVINALNQQAAGATSEGSGTAEGEYAIYEPMENSMRNHFLSFNFSSDQRSDKKWRDKK